MTKRAKRKKTTSANRRISTVGELLDVLRQAPRDARVWLLNTEFAATVEVTRVRGTNAEPEPIWGPSYPDILSIRAENVGQEPPGPKHAHVVIG